MKLSRGRFFIIVLVLICSVLACYVLIPHPHVSEKLTEKDISSNTPPDVTKLIKMTLSSDQLSQVIGARELGLLGPRAVPAIPFLIQLSSNEEDFKPEHEPLLSSCYEMSNKFNPFLSGFSESTTSRYEAGCALRAIGEPASQILIEILKDKHAEPCKRRAAAWVFMEGFQPTMKDLFIKILSNKKEDDDVRLCLVNALGATDDSKLLNLYHDILSDKTEDEYLRESILKEFQRHRDFHPGDSFLSTLRAILDDKDEHESVRASAGHVLAMHANDETIDYVTRQLDGQFCKYIAEGMAMNPSQKAKRTVLDLVNKSSRDIKASLLSGMGESKDPEYEDILIQNAGSGDTWPRMCAALGLYYFNNEKTIDKLFSVVNDPKEKDEEVQYRAIMCLARMKNNGIIDRLFDAQSHSEYVHHCLLENLRRDDHLLNKWIETLNNKSLPANYRRNAVIAIDVCNGASEKGPRALAKAAMDEDKEIRHAIAFVLGRIGTAEEIPILEALAKDNEIVVSNEAKEAIKKLNSAQ
ncbi:MAG: HEAT repeat domain-containing protein [Thermoguttaceae bacterium]